MISLKTIKSVFSALLLASVGSVLGSYLVACDDEGPSQPQNASMHVVSSAKDLAECEDDNDGEMVWVKGERSARICAEGEWQSAAEPLKDTVTVATDTVYTKGENVECAIENLKNKTGVKVVCNGDSIGVVYNGRNGEDGSDGKNGKNGSDGKQGSDGEDGETCKLTDNKDGKVFVVCGKDSVTFYKAMCGERPYDPENRWCVEGTVLAKCGSQFYNPDSLLCDIRDYRTYRYVTIGNQIWMAENLNYVNTHDETNDSIGGSWCSPDADSCARFGRYYSWPIAMDCYGDFSDAGVGCVSGQECNPQYPVRGICPEGWHLPDTTDWEILESYVNNDYRALEATGFKGWPYATDRYGFSVLPTGFVRQQGEGIVIGNVGTNMAFWTMTEVSGSTAASWDIADNRLPKFWIYDKVVLRFPIRCLKD